MNLNTEIQYINKVSWGSIIGGVVTVLAVSMLLSTLGTSLGFSMVDPLSSDPVNGVGTSVLIWWVVSIIVSLACGGFVAGRLAANSGLIHGFLVWATSLLVAAIVGGMLISGAVKATGNAIGSIASATGNVVSGVGSAAGSAVSGAANMGSDILDNLDIDTNLDQQQMSNEIRQALRDSNIDSLQPEFLQRQLEGARDDLGRAVRQFAANPNNLDSIIQRLSDRLQNRVQAIGQDVDRDSLTQALAQNTSMSQEEINQMVDNWIEARNRTAQVVSERLDDAQQQIQQARQQYEEFKQQALVQADRAASAVAKTALASFFALLIGSIISAYAGLVGVRRGRRFIITKTEPVA